METFKLVEAVSEDYSAETQLDMLSSIGNFLKTVCYFMLWPGRRFAHDVARHGK